ncbi:MAG: hypothetical protein Q9174_002573 [Haloplaca sp. 1 TL-2023]
MSGSSSSKTMPGDLELPSGMLPDLECSEDWADWKLQFLQLLKAKRLTAQWRASDATSTDMTDDERTKLRVICDVVKGTGGEVAQSLVRDLPHLSSMYDALERHFEPSESLEPSETDLFLLAFRQLQSLNFKDFDDVPAYATEYKRIMENLQKHGYVLPAMFTNTHFVQGLAATYPDIVSAAVRANIITAEAGQTSASFEQAVYFATAFEKVKRMQEEKPTGLDIVIESF